MNTKEYIREQGRQEGMRQGMRQGMQQGMQRMRQVVLNMLQKKTDIAFISEVTGLPETEIIKLKNGN